MQTENNQIKHIAWRNRADDLKTLQGRFFAIGFKSTEMNRFYIISHKKITEEQNEREQIENREEKNNYPAKTRRILLEEAQKNIR